MNYYMHKMDGRPAYYHPTQKLIFFASQRTPAHFLLVKDLQTLRHQQAMCRMSRVIDQNPNDFKYDYLLVQRIEDVIPYDLIVGLVQHHLLSQDPREIDHGVVRSDAFSKQLAEFLKDVQL